MTTRNIKDTISEIYNNPKPAPSWAGLAVMRPLMRIELDCKRKTTKMKPTATETDNNMAMAAKDVLAAAKYALSIIELIPAFGDEIGKDISKAQLGTACKKLKIAILKAKGK